MKKKILILGGGYSKERSISLKSAKAVIKSVKNEYKVRFVDPCNDFFKTVERDDAEIIKALNKRIKLEKDKVTKEQELRIQAEALENQVLDANKAINQNTDGYKSQVDKINNISTSS